MTQIAEDTRQEPEQDYSETIGFIEWILPHADIIRQRGNTYKVITSEKLDSIKCDALKNLGFDFEIGSYKLSGFIEIDLF